MTVAFGSTMATALLSKDNSLVQIVLAFAVLVGLQWIVTWCSVRSITAERWVKSEPRLLFWKAQFKRENMLEERVTEKEIRAAVRSEGLMALEDVEAVVMETNGVFSVIKKQGSSASALADVVGYSDVS